MSGIERPKSALEQMAERCALVIADHAAPELRDPDRYGLEMISGFAWALGFDVGVALAPRKDRDD